MALAKGVQTVANCAKVTLGPQGRNVLLAREPWRPPIVTNDGVTIAKDISLVDPFANLGCKMVQEAAEKTKDRVGDGTTTSLVLTQYLVQKGLSYIAAQVNHLKLLHGMELAVQEALVQLKQRAV